MNDLTLSEELLSAVQDLASARPHERPGIRHPPEAWRIYADGYYVALCVSLKAMELACERRALRERLELEAARRAVRRYMRFVLRRARSAAVARSARGAA